MLLRSGNYVATDMTRIARTLIPEPGLCLPCASTRPTILKCVTRLHESKGEVSRYYHLQAFVNFMTRKRCSVIDSEEKQLALLQLQKIAEELREKLERRYGYALPVPISSCEGQSCTLLKTW